MRNEDDLSAAFHRTQGGDDRLVHERVVEIVLRLIDEKRPFAGWEALRGQVVIGNLIYSFYRVVLIGIAVACVAGLWFLLQKTPFGRVVRAGVQNPDMVGALGISLQPYMVAVAGLGIGLAGLAGVLLAPIYAVQSMMRPLAHAGSRDLLLGRQPSAALEAAHSPARNVTAQTPPCFLVHAEDDPVVDVGNTLELRAALKAAGIPVETHLFAQGGHGFGLRRAAGKPAQAWPALFLAWAESLGFG